MTLFGSVGARGVGACDPLGAGGAPGGWGCGAAGE